MMSQRNTGRLASITLLGAGGFAVTGYCSVVCLRLLAEISAGVIEGGSLHSLYRHAAWGIGGLFCGCLGLFAMRNTHAAMTRERAKKQLVVGMVVFVLCLLGGGWLVPLSYMLRASGWKLEEFIENFGMDFVGLACFALVVVGCAALYSWQAHTLARRLVKYGINIGFLVSAVMLIVRTIRI
jgi:hypothetical protein